MGRTWVALAVALLALAGCTAVEEGAKKDDQDDPGTGSTPAAPASFTETTGGIEVTVVDESELPIEGAQVGMDGLPVGLTDAEGRVSINDVEPGAHDIAVAKIGFDSVARRVDVIVGEVTKLQVPLAAVEVIVPFSDVLLFDGHILVGEAFVDIVTGTMGLPGCQPCQFEINATYPGLMTLWFEITFQPTLPNPTGDRMGYQVWTLDGSGGLGDNLASGNWRSGGHFRVDGDNWTEAQQFQLVNYCDALWVCVDQKFTNYVTRFFNEKAPKEYSAIT